MIKIEIEFQCRQMCVYAISELDEMMFGHLKQIFSVIRRINYILPALPVVHGICLH